MEEKKMGMDMEKELGEDALEAVAGGGYLPFWDYCHYCNTYFNLTANSQRVIDGKNCWVCPECANKGL